MRIYLLGCGTPTADGNRFGSSYVIQIKDDYLMFDCGPATTFKLAKSKIKPTWINYLFFTHHHFDHDVDYPCFLLSRWNESIGNEEELKVFGPNLTEKITYRLFDEKEGAFAHDWIARINHPLSLNAHTSRGGSLPRKPLEVNVKDISPGLICNTKNWSVTAAPAEHVEPWLDSLAYRLDSPEGSIVITGDTRPCKTVSNLSKNADILINLCTSIQEDVEGSPEAEYMCSTIDAAKVANEANVKKLILVHQSPYLDHPGKTERAISDISSIYKGEIIWGEELMYVDV